LALRILWHLAALVFPVFLMGLNYPTHPVDREIQKVRQAQLILEHQTCLEFLEIR